MRHLRRDQRVFMMPAARRHLFRRRGADANWRLGRLVVAAIATLVTLKPASAVDEYFYHQSYNMAGRGSLTIVDFHYSSQPECAKALAEMKSMMAKANPAWVRTAAVCSAKLTPDYVALMENRAADIPYVSFRDMRQWVDGVAAVASLKFCVTTAKEPRFHGEAKCIHR